MRRFAYLVLIFSLVFALGILGSCAQVVEPEEPDDPEEPDEIVEPPEPEEPRRVVIAQATDVRSWDPPQDWISAAEWITQNAYDYLFIRSHDGAEWVPELAYDWDVIDELTFRFYLHEGVKFHDGTELTAHDVKHHYRRVIDAESREEYIVLDQYQWIDKFVIHDDYTFDVVSKEPDSLFLFKLSQKNTGMGIVSKAYFEEVGMDGVHHWPMGSGPWVLREHVRDEHVLFDRNEDYWQTDKFPNFEEFEFRIVPEASTRVAELLTGGVDLIYDIMPEDQARVDADPNVRTQWVATERGNLLAVRTGIRARDNYPEPDYPDDPTLNRSFTTEDPRVRKAIELALDKYALRDMFGGVGEAFRVRGPFGPLPESPPGVFGPEACLYDPERAQEILEEAGYEFGEPYLHFIASELYPHGDMARVIGDMLEAVGFDVDLAIFDASTWRTDYILPGKTQELNLQALGGNMNPYFATSEQHTRRIFPDRPVTIGPDPAIDPDYEEQSQRINELLNFAWTEVVDEQARLDAYHEAVLLAGERNAPFIGIFQLSTLYGMSDRIHYQPRFDIELWGYDFQVVK